MAQYRKKHIVIEAEVYKPGMEDAFETRYASEKNPNQTWGFPTKEDCIPVEIPYIDTLEGKCLITNGDYIITGVKGERYPCKPDIFEMTYEAVEDGE